MVDVCLNVFRGCFINMYVLCIRDMYKMRFTPIEVFKNMCLNVFRGCFINLYKNS